MASSPSNLIFACGLAHFTYRSDKEHSLKMLAEDSIRESGRQGVSLNPEDQPDYVPLLGRPGGENEDPSQPESPIADTTLLSDGVPSQSASTAEGSAPDAQRASDPSAAGGVSPKAQSPSSSSARSPMVAVPEHSCRRERLEWCL